VSKDKEFDNYIKGLFNEDPKAPSELRWEAMDFDLPNPKKKEPKSNKKYWLLLLLLLFTSSALYLATKYDLISIGQDSNALSQTSINNQKSEKTLSKNNLEIQNQSSKQQAITEEVNSSNKSLEGPSDILTIEKNKDQSNSKNSNNESLKNTSNKIEDPITKNVESSLTNNTVVASDQFASEGTLKLPSTAAKNISLVTDFETSTGVDESLSSASIPVLNWIAQLLL